MNASRKSASAPAPSRLRLIALLALVAGIVLLAAAAVFWLRPTSDPGPTAESGVVRVGEGAAIGGPFQLVDQNGRSVTQADFAGKFMLIYFGFTYCPDVCPTELQVMGNAMDALSAEDAARVVPIFITVDPERDTPEQLKGYVAAFHPKMIGLTGTPEQIAAVAKAYKVYYSKQPNPAAPDDYSVDHTSFVYLMGPDGVLRSMFRSGATAKTMAGEIRAQLHRSS
jgi:protein SCO1/2